MIQISEASLKLVRDYAVEEPSYTVSFAAWDLGVSRAVVDAANAELLRLGIVSQIEPRNGPYAAVYAYRPPSSARPVSRLFPELDESRALGIGADAPVRGKVVPH